MGYIAKRALTLKVLFPGEDGAWWLEVEQDRQINKQQTEWMILYGKTDRHIKTKVFFKT